MDKLTLSKIDRFRDRIYYYLKYPLNINNDITLITKILNDIKVTPGIRVFEYKHYKNHTEKIAYYNIPCTFDIETTQTNNGAYMYIWQFNINGVQIYGRTWQELELLIKLVYYKLDLAKNKLICYIQNLSYEYQFIRKRFASYITNVFATDRRTILKCECGGLILKDSYILYGCGLEKIGKDLQYFPFRKTHDLNYLVLRNSKTELKNKELKYCLLDTIVLSCAIFEKIIQHKYIYNIPMTKTGYVRQHYKEYLYKDKFYQDIIKNLTLTEEQYLQYKRAFCGGYAHGNCFNNSITFYNSISFDECSEYPFTMCAYKYPIKFKENINKITEEDARKIDTNKLLWVADFSFYNLKAKDNICDNTLSEHKCQITGNVIVNNGRVVSADKLQTSLTCIDFETLGEFYTWDRVNICNVNVYYASYLPKSFIIALLDLFKAKNELKPLIHTSEEIAQEYKLKKENLNASYGACVEDVIKQLLEFAKGDLYPSDLDINGQLDKYNESNKRWNYFLWGVFITAYARRDLYYIFIELARQGLEMFYLLSDTDSIKCKNDKRIHDIINAQNERKTNCLLEMCAKMKISPDYKDTIVKYGLGLFEIDNEYLAFKEFGSKRYCYIDKDYHLGVTIAGLPKKAITKMVDKYGKYKVFEMIQEDIVFDEETSCKLTHTFFDFPTKEIIEGEEMQEYSSIVLFPTTFKMGFAPEFETFLDSLPKIDVKFVLSKYL